MSCESRGLRESAGTVFGRLSHVPLVAPEAGPSASTSLPTIVRECEKVMAHAWMVRTFVKHSDEVHDFPELMQLVRAVFDISRALETRVTDPRSYLQMLQKKMGRLRRVAAQFRTDAVEASSHMNFKQAVVSMDACIERLDRLLDSGLASIGRSVTVDA